MPVFPTYTHCLSMTVATMIIGTWAKCAKGKVEHYYELHQSKYEIALNRNDSCFGDSRKLIRKRGAINDKIENQTGKP